MRTDFLGGTIQDLIETLEDGRKGFDQVAQKLKDEGDVKLAEKMWSFAEQRAQFSAELREIARDHGVVIEEEEGTIAGALHRGWMDLKASLASDDAAALLAAAEAGEDHAVAEYRDALEQDLPEDVREVVVRQSQAVQAVHDEVKALRDSR